ncbi:response regulator transcription factor [Cerasicoccus frondis]|uniref:response regulator transcription factor n=1 Tax=Cerasicoccus frondis TaxID=490090 RepID=UPI002852C707|nr:response regulator transcription factor [Cerasicoccus frondis]
MKKVVVVEDELMFREFIANLIRDSSMLELVGESGDGLDGYKLIAELKPDIAIIDIMLPNLNGIGIMQKLKRELPNVSVLALSSFPHRDYVQKLLECGVSGMVQKSESLTILDTAINMVAAGQTYFSPNISSHLREVMLHPEQANSVKDLSNREREVLQLIAESNSNKEIAGKLGISVKTAETHRQRIINKLDIHDTAGLTRYAIVSGLTEL